MANVLVENAEVFFFPNGNTAVCTDGSQIPKLQVPWVVVWIEWLESQGYDPTEFVMNLPSGKARPFRTSEGNWNWKMES